jgi:hypothetical protein
LLRAASRTSGKLKGTDEDCAKAGERTGDTANTIAAQALEKKNCRMLMWCLSLK